MRELIEKLARRGAVNSKEEIHRKIWEVIGKAEKQHGHAFAGGRGLSMFVVVHLKNGGKINAYGNGVVDNELEAMLKREIPEVDHISTRLD